MYMLNPYSTLPMYKYVKYLDVICLIDMQFKTLRGGVLTKMVVEMQ